MTTRRNFMKGLGAAGLAATMLPRSAQAALSGSSVNCGVYKTLYIHIYGALSHRETTWLDDPGAGWADWRVDPDMSEVDAAASGADKSFFTSVDDHDVYLGAGFDPLVQAGVDNRLRLVALSHTVPAAHSLGATVALTGIEQGRPGMASLASRVNARFAEPGGLPAAYIVDAFRSGLINGVASSTGDLGSQYRPFPVPVGSDNFKSFLDRAAKDHTDGLVDLYRRRYAERLTHSDGPNRSHHFDVYDDALTRMQDWPGVHEVISAGPTLYGTSTSFYQNRVTRGIGFGAYLLSAGARHVTVIAGSTGAPTVDTHSLGDDDPGTDDDTSYEEHSRRQNGVLWGVCQALADAIDSGELNLDDTLVYIGTEFGRAKSDGNGTEHWTAGYATALLGGPVTSKGTAGRLSFASESRGLAVDGFHPKDVVMGLSMASGVEPFQPGMFSLEDCSFAAATEDDAKEHLGTELLGAPTQGCEPGPGPGDEGI